MSRFQNIDAKLNQLATRLNARLTKDRPGYPEVLRTFEERRIDWIDGQIKKAIIIQPVFESRGVNSALWNFFIIAWVEKNGVPKLPAWERTLIAESDFQTIKDSIDDLLIVSENKLKRIQIEDLD